MVSLLLPFSSKTGTCIVTFFIKKNTSMSSHQQAPSPLVQGSTLYTMHACCMSAKRSLVNSVRWSVTLACCTNVVLHVRSPWFMPGNKDMEKERPGRQKEAKPSSTNQGYLASDRHAAIDERGYYFLKSWEVIFLIRRFGV